MIKTFRANGKLLLSGEYFVLDGAKALAVPTQKGQTLEVSALDENYLLWQSWTVDGTLWFECRLNAIDLKILVASDQDVADRLVLMLQNAKMQNPAFLLKNGLKISTYLEFARDWGLGSSSTLICLIAKWAKVDAFQILFHSMRGSGYDIACGMTDTPIFYEINGQTPTVEVVSFFPQFAENLYFVHLGKKQNSREGIARYRAKAAQNEVSINEISAISKEILISKDLQVFNDLLLRHEEIISKIIELPRAKTLYFPDFHYGEIKSLGAWGGDFVLVSSDIGFEKTKEYFQSKNYRTCIPYHKMILSMK